jgi:hypothetical protein
MPGEPMMTEAQRAELKTLCAKQSYLTKRGIAYSTGRAASYRCAKEANRRAEIISAAG